MDGTPQSILGSRPEFKELPTTPAFLAEVQGATDRPSVGKWEAGSDLIGFTVRDKYLSHWNTVLGRAGVPVGEGLLVVQDDEKNIFYRIELGPGAEEFDLKQIIDSNLPD